MRKKLNQSITKIINMDINSFQACVYFNMYMIRSVFFGCRIIDLSVTQDNEIKRIYELPIAKKLQLGEKFPSTVLYSQRSALGVGLV